MATATASSAACSDYFLCAYQHNDLEGMKLFTSDSNTNWDYLGNPSAFRQLNDKASWAKNNTEQTYAKIFQHDNQAGNSICIRPGREYNDFPDSINDKSASHRFYAAC